MLLWLCMDVHAQLGRYRADFHVWPANFADTIAVEWQGGQVYVPLAIEGRNYRFLLDTGASQTVVFSSSPLAKGPQAGKILSHDAAGHTDTVSMVMLPPVQLGQTRLSGLRATVQPTASRLDGILGFDLVNGGLSIKIDVPNRQLIITDRKHHFDLPRHAAKTRGTAAVQLKYYLNYHVPYLDIIPFGHARQRVLFDTGSRQFFSMNKSQFDEAVDGQFNRRKNAKKADFIVEGTATGRHAIGHHGTEPVGQVAFLRFDSLRLGRYAFSHVHSLTTQGGSHLGAMLLRYGAVTFIADKRRFLFQPTSPQQPCAVDNHQIEIAFVADSLGRPQVGLVWEQGTPYRLGFRQGDIIEQIDHRPVATMSQFVNFSFVRGREYLFTICSPQGLRRSISWVRLPATPYTGGDKK